jgi:tungstate transport system substrate-binding protein
MGPTLNIAAALNAYTLTDRATWTNFNNGQHLEILIAGDRRCSNVMPASSSIPTNGHA